MWSQSVQFSVELMTNATLDCVDPGYTLSVHPGPGI